MQRSISVSNTSGLPGQNGPNDPGISIKDIIRVLRARAVLIFGCALACVLCSLIYLRMTRPLYEGTATVRIDPSRASSLGLSDLGVAGGSDADSDLHTEIAVLKSDGVALRTLRALPAPVFQSLTGVSQTTAAMPQDVAALSASQQKILNALKGNTEAKPIEGTSLISVSVRAADPRTAADVTNALVNAYIIQSFTSRDNSVTELKAWLSAQMATLKNQVDSAQRKLADFQEANNIIGIAGAGADGNTVTDRLRILNQSLATAQSDRIEKEARLRAASNADPSVLATLFPDPTLNALQTSQVQLQSRAAELSSKFGPKYPPLAEINKQLSTLDAEVAKSENEVRKRLQQEFDASKATQDMLQKEYDDQTRIAYGINRNQAEYAVLQGDVTTSRELYDVLRRKMEQASVDADVNGLKTVRVDSSPVPTNPVEPKQLLIIVGGAILGLFAGVVAAFVGEASSDRLQTRSQVQRELGLPVLGMLPRSARGDDELPMIQRSSSKDAEAYRLLRSVLLALSPNPVKKIFISSALPEEGASAVAGNLAVSLAQTGYRTLLVDSDLRSPSLHQLFSVDNTSGLSTSLLNPESIAGFVQPVTSLTNLTLLPAGPSITFPAERLCSDAFSALMAEWEKAYDFVVIHSAPLLVVSDGICLARTAEAVLLVARHGTTHLQSLDRARLLLESVGVGVSGIVVDEVPQANLESDTYGKVADAYFA